MATTDDPLAQISARLDRVEASLARITHLLDEVSPNLAMVGDMADAWVRQANERGVDVDARVQAAAEAVETATTPEALHSLGRMGAQAPGLESPVGLLAGFDDHVAMAGDIADEWVRERQAAGDDPQARLEAVLGAVDRLTEPRTLGALVQLADRAEGLTTVVDLAAGFDDHLAMAGDIADEVVRDLDADGPTVDDRLTAASQALLRLSDPEVLASLTRIADQAPRLERLVDLAAGFDDHLAMVGDIVDELVRDEVSEPDVRVEALVRGAEVWSRPETLDALTRLSEALPGLLWVTELTAGAEDHLAMVSEIFDDWVKQEGAHGVDVDQRLRDLLQLARELSAPQVTTAVRKLLRQLPDLADHLEAAPGWVAMGLDILDELQDEVRRKGVDVDELMAVLFPTASSLIDVATSGVLERLLDSPLMDPSILDANAKIAWTIVDTFQTPQEPLGPFGLLRALREPNVQRALGASIEVARALGSLQAASEPHQLFQRD